MATWTSTQLATAVLQFLRVTGSGQSAAAEDTVKVTDAYASVYPQLRRFGLAPWGAEAIEEEAQEPLKKYMGCKLASTFGFSGQSLAEKYEEGRQGYRELQEQASGDRSSLQVRPRWF